MYIGGAKRCACVPADRLADGYKEILSLLRNRGEGLQNDVTILRANPDGSSRVVSLQVEPRKIVPLEDV